MSVSVLCSPFVCAAHYKFELPQFGKELLSRLAVCFLVICLSVISVGGEQDFGCGWTSSWSLLTIYSFLDKGARRPGG